jgi:uncharacterized membrane protein
MMKQRPIDLFAVITMTIIAVVLALVAPPGNMTVRILTLPLAIVFPGYALSSALFPRRALVIPERIVFSLGLSLIIVILSGLVLNLTPFGLRTNSWAVCLGGITLGASGVALVRRRGQDEPAPRWLMERLTFRKGLLLVLAGVIICGAVAVSINGASQQSHTAFTQLWILPVSGANSKNTVRLGVSNMEPRAENYLLEVDVNGLVAKVWPAIDLRPNENWETTLVLQQTGRTGQIGPAKVEVFLYRDTSTTVYRHVLLWLGT